MLKFVEKYTTNALILSDLSKDKDEKDKVVLSNDAYAIGTLLESLNQRIETLNNRLVK